MPRKENTKAKTWERDRRKRMNTYFKTLGDLLPPHQEGRKRNKVDILIHASKYIKDLHSRTDELFFAHASEAHKEELARLKKLVSQLFSRTQLLSALLKEAGITIPAEPALEKISPLKWSNKLNVEDAEKYFSRIEEKKKGTSTVFKVPSKRKSVATSETFSKKSHIVKSLSKEAQRSIENQENRVSSINNKKEDTDSPNKISEEENKEIENSSTFVCNGTTTISSTNVTAPIKKLVSQRKVKRKGKKKDNKHASKCVHNSMANLTPSTIILSGGKLMPLVTPITSLTSNIIVNTQQQSVSPIILGNPQQNQMIVMQPLANQAQNSVLSVRNQTLINGMQKVTLNAVPNVRTNMVIDSQNWVSNVKNIIDSTKIGGHKGILPKIKEVTNTTMTYKVPIPAIHKDKVEKCKDNGSKKETESKSRVGKNHLKNTKNQQLSEDNIVNKSGKGDKNTECNTEKVSVKRTQTLDLVSVDEPETKKCKKNETEEILDITNVQTSNAKKDDFSATCKSIQSLKHVVEKIGDDTDASKKQHSFSSMTEENCIDKSNDNNKEFPNPLPQITPSHKSDCDSLRHLGESNSHIVDNEDTTERDISTKPLLSSDLLEKTLNSEDVRTLTTPITTQLSLPLSTPEKVTSNNLDSNECLAQAVESERAKDVGNLGSQFDNLLPAHEKETESIASVSQVESNKIILNLDTNTTTTMKPETNVPAVQTSDFSTPSPPVSSSLLPVETMADDSKAQKSSKLAKTLSYSTDNTFVPISSRSEGIHSDLSNDIFASLQVPSSSHNSESISPTAAFLMAFPLVSSLNGKTEVLDEEMKDDFKYNSQTPPMLLQIGAMEPNTFKIKTSQSNLSEEHLKTSFEQKKEDAVTSADGDSLASQIVSTDTTRPVKILPKVINDEKLREPYKIVHSAAVSNLGSGNTYLRAPLFNSNTSTSRSNFVVKDEADRSKSIANSKVNEAVTCVSSPTTGNENIMNSTISKCNDNERCIVTQDFLPNYSAVGSASEALQQTTSASFVMTNTTVQNLHNVGIPRNQTSASETSFTAGLGNVSTTNSTSMPSLSIGYSTAVAHVDGSLPISSQSVKPNYSVQTKDSTLSTTYAVTTKEKLLQDRQQGECVERGENALVEPSILSKQRLESLSQDMHHSMEISRGMTIAASDAPFVSHLNDIPTATNNSLTPISTNYSSAKGISLPPLTAEYNTILKEKHSQDPQRVGFVARNTEALESDVITDQRLEYPPQLDASLPTSTQSLSEDYPSEMKTQSHPILPNQGIQSAYSIEAKDVATQHSSQRTFVEHDKDHAVSNPHQNYTIDSVKNTSHKDSRTYSTTSTNDNSMQTQNYSSKASNSSSTENSYQPNYSKINKHDTTTTAIDNTVKLNNAAGSKLQEQDHRRDSEYTSSKKINIDQFEQNFPYGTKESIGVQADQTVIDSGVENLFHGKRDNSQNYVPYREKDMKKVGTSTSNSLITKVTVQNTPVLHYSQQQTSSFVATSNYEHSTMTDNHAKSTTTVAHNSSNFSILSWTTFSPVSGGGNNNLIQFDQGPTQNDVTEAKTICENYSYVPLHKETANFSGSLTNDVYSVNSSIVDVEKTRMKSAIDTRKQQFVDNGKARNMQPTAQSASKANRMQNHNQNTSSNNDYKFDSENKNRNKYDYVQNEYPGIHQQLQQPQQHDSKDHEMLTVRQDKTAYPPAGYDTQMNFDLPEGGTQMKYSIEGYSGANFKYSEKMLQENQHKYQLPQGQVLPHDGTGYNSENNKHNQQQHSTNKLKPIQQHQPARAPVNWMMTPAPEIKHNTNISDIILPPIGKELEFCQNNLFTQTSTYNQGTPNQFYNNYDVATHSFPNLPVLQSESKRTTDVFYSEEQPFPWSPTKSLHVEQSQSAKNIDQHIVPSTLPTLVGDLALGTNIPEKQNFLFGQMPSRISTDQNKEFTKDKSGHVAGRDFHSISNPQNVQQSVQGSSFLSVSQLVEHEKAEKSQQQHHHQHHQHHHHHPQQHQQQQPPQPQQQQARKHQRKSNTSPRGNSKRQMDIRKQTSGSDQLHQRHEEQKTSGNTFSEHTYQSQQQQKYQQNNVVWRSRNCKSNYTAEALISTNTNVHDANNRDKHAAIKFVPNYTQNKFQSNLTTADTVVPINYFSNVEDGTGYGQVVNQNFNSYPYSSNANIYPTSNFITSISNTPTTYMMPLHENTDYMEPNTFLIPNVTATSALSSSTTSTSTTTTANGPGDGSSKSHPHYTTGKHPNCDNKRSYTTNAKKGKKKVLENTNMQNLDFTLSGINSPHDDYHHATTFLPPPPPPPPSHANSLYQNHPQSNMYAKSVNGLPPPPPPPPTVTQSMSSVATAGFPVNANLSRSIASSNPMTMPHHPSGTSLTNFNLSTIFPEMNDKITGYKPSNVVPTGLPQPSNHGSTTYAQRTNYTTNSLCHLPQVSESTQFSNAVPPPLPPGIIHYKNV